MWRPGRAVTVAAMTRFTPLAVLAFLAACAQVTDGPGGPAPDTAEPPPAAPEELAAVVRAPPPRSGANTVDSLDTTTEAQRAAATAAPAREGERLGEETVSLGDPTDPGLWIRTPLVSSRQAGRVAVAGTGRSATLELIPLEGEGGAQLSLAAFRLLEVPLTELPTVTVFRQ